MRTTHNREIYFAFRVIRDSHQKVTWKYIYIFFETKTCHLNQACFSLLKVGLQTSSSTLILKLTKHLVISWLKLSGYMKLITISIRGITIWLDDIKFGLPWGRIETVLWHWKTVGYIHLLDNFKWSIK